jgi:hypothetical protein
MRRLLILASVAVSVLSTEVVAQGKGANKGNVPPGQSKKHVTPSNAVVVVREMLGKHGYQVVHVEQLGGSQVVYFRRGNMGKGKGLGPMEKMIIRPSGAVVVFDNAPRLVLVDVKVKLGL